MSPARPPEGTHSRWGGGRRHLGAPVSGLPVLAVFASAGFGVLLRWWQGSWLNPASHA